MRERRREPRVNAEAEITVRIYAAPEQRELEGKIFPSHATDISFGGLQMHLESDIPVGTLLGLEVVFSGSSMKYLHLGKVMWKQHQDSGNGEQSPCYKTGIMFESFDNAMHDLWISEVMHILEKNKRN